MNRRSFISTTAATVGLATVVPRNVLGKGFIAPSDKITLINIGCGSQGLAEIGALLACPQIEIVGVADPNRQTNDYIWWGVNGQRDALRRLIEQPTWMEGITGHPGGRNIMKYVVEEYYKKNRQGWNGTIAAEEDYREMLSRMSDVDAVKIIPCDHLHSYMSVDCFKRGKHQIMHKPLGNKLKEAMKVVDMSVANQNVATHMMAYNSSTNNGINQTKAWIDAGAIGTLREIHNWSMRPVWPQYQEVPTERALIPPGFNWDLWLGPSQMRDYSPKYTHCCFRGWFEFGGGSIADMGIYSMLPVFDKLALGSAISASSRFSRVVRCNYDSVPSQVHNTWSFPDAAAFRFEIPYKNKRGTIFFTWHDGGMKPNVPYGYKDDDLPIEGMMFIGEKGVIVGGFNGQNPELVGLTPNEMRRYANITAPAMPNQREVVSPGTPRWLQGWIDNVKGGQKNPGSFEFIRELTETYNLGAVSLMCNGKKLIYDPATRSITNDAQANKLLERDTRKGWEFV
jgi:predicted dehydrogenase